MTLWAIILVETLNVDAEHSHTGDTSDFGHLPQEWREGQYELFERQCQFHVRSYQGCPFLPGVFAVLLENKCNFSLMLRGSEMGKFGKTTCNSKSSIGNGDAIWATMMAIRITTCCRSNGELYKRFPQQCVIFVHLR